MSACSPFGDAADVLLSDAIPAVLAAYDTIVLAHRLTTDSEEVSRRLAAFMLGGGNVLATASTLADLQAASSSGAGSLAQVTIGACSSAPAGTIIDVVGGAAIVEPLPFVLCALSFASPAPPNSSWAVLATSGGLPVALRVHSGNGSLIVVAAGNHGMSTASASPGHLYTCGVDEPDSRSTQPFAMASFVRHFVEGSLAAAATFDLGPDLAWVPKRIGQRSYVLTVTNPTLMEAPLVIASPLGPVAWVSVLPLDESEKNATGYLPHGFEGTNIGQTTNTTIAGGDTIVLRIELASDASTTVVNTTSASPPAAWSQRRLLRLQPGSGDIRREVLSRSAFDATFGGCRCC